MSKKHSIDDDTWLSILNGSEKADPNDSEQLQVAQIRNILLEQYAEEKTTETTAAQEAHYEKERNKVLELLKATEKKPPPSTSTIEVTQTSFFNKISQFITHHKNIIGPIVLISFLGVTITPLLLQNTPTPKTNPTESITLDGMTKKGTTPMPPAIKRVEFPKQYALSLQEKLQQTGLKVSLKEVSAGWLLETELPVPVYKHQDVIAVLEEFGVEMPFGGSFLVVVIKK